MHHDMYVYVHGVMIMGVKYQGRERMKREKGRERGKRKRARLTDFG